MQQTRAFLFDFDGTLVDTAPDLATSLNLLLQYHNKVPLPFAQIRPVCSLGTPGLLKLGFGIQPEDDNFQTLRQAYLDIYSRHLFEKTMLFPGAEKLLTQLESQKIAWGIVTNKPKALTLPIMTHFNLHPTDNCLITPEHVDQRKPHPEPVLKACQQLKLKPNQCSFVGDSDKDAYAAKAAGIKTIYIVKNGYIPPGQNLNDWPGIKINDLLELCMH